MSLSIVYSLLTAEDIWCKCELSLRFIPPINLWKICIILRPFSKYFRVPFLRTLRSPMSNPIQFEIQNDEIFFILKLYQPLQRCLLTCQANSAFLGRFFVLGSSNSEGPIQQNLKIIFKPKILVSRPDISLHLLYEFQVV